VQLLTLYCLKYSVWTNEINQKLLFCGKEFITHLFTATIHFVTDRQIDRQTDDSIMPRADHTCVHQYDRLKLCSHLNIHHLHTWIMLNSRWHRLAVRRRLQSQKKHKN